VSKEVPQGWAAVGEAVGKNRRARKISQEELAVAAQTGLSTIQEIENHTKERKRAKGTLERISKALGLEKEHLDDILTGRRTIDEATGEPSLTELGEMITQIIGKLDTIETHMASIDARLEAQGDILHHIAPPVAGVGFEKHRSGQDTSAPQERRAPLPACSPTPSPGGLTAGTPSAAPFSSRGGACTGSTDPCLCCSPGAMTMPGSPARALRPGHRHDGSHAALRPHQQHPSGIMDGRQPGTALRVGRENREDAAKPCT
jgi:transcriptional regulator with XRE-family HTH domain